MSECNIDLFSVLLKKGISTRDVHSFVQKLCLKKAGNGTKLKILLQKNIEEGSALRQKRLKREVEL